MESSSGRNHVRVAASEAFVQSARYVLFWEKTNAKQTQNLLYRLGGSMYFLPGLILTKDLTDFYT